METLIKKVKHGTVRADADQRCRRAGTARTRIPAIWGGELAEFLATVRQVSDRSRRCSWPAPLGFGDRRRRRPRRRSAAVAAGVENAARRGRSQTYPHDRAAFTQGLRAASRARSTRAPAWWGSRACGEVELATGRVIRKIDVPPPIFAEGLALVGDRLIQLTWQHGSALRLRPADVRASRASFTYRGEGWGLCHDGTQLVMSDGSSNLTIRNAADFSVIRTVARDAGRPAARSLERARMRRRRGLRQRVDARI